MYTPNELLQNTRSQSAVFFASRCSVTVPSNGDSSALVLTLFPSGYHLRTDSWQQVRVKVSFPDGPNYIASAQTA
jgi:hypothetical protein